MRPCPLSRALLTLCRVSARHSRAQCGQRHRSCHIAIDVAMWQCGDVASVIDRHSRQGFIMPGLAPS